MLRAWDPNVARGFYIYGGKWDAPILWPAGLSLAWFHDEAIHNLLPNQELLSGSESVRAEVGDYVFVHPQEGDAMAVFDRIMAVRGGKIEARWKPLAILN